MSLKENILKVTGGERVAAVATVQEGKPVVRFMALFGLDDLTLIGATMKSSRKVEQIKKNPEPENPEYVVLKFVPQRIEYYHDMNMEVWED
jgi:general stress protein 26